MKKIRFLSALLLPFSLMGLASCSGTKEEQGFSEISQKEAKELMDREEGYIIVDARSEEEYKEGHIENAIVLPHDEITERAEKELPSKEQLILVYCRSGRRSKIAAEALVKLGYTNVKEFGGIITWPYEIVY